MQTPAIIQTMIDTLGGQRIFAMAFASAGYSGNRLTLRVARALVKHAKGKATHVVVTLEADDTYTVKAVRSTKAVGYDLDEVATVYADNLRQVVESMTGLQLTLGTMGAAS